jgi:hypothetical protein
MHTMEPRAAVRADEVAVEGDEVAVLDDSCAALLIHGFVRGPDVSKRVSIHSPPSSMFA